jgi:hypothetical protein
MKRKVRAHGAPIHTQIYLTRDQHTSAHTEPKPPEKPPRTWVLIVPSSFLMLFQLQEMTDPARNDEQLLLRLRD